MADATAQAAAPRRLTSRRNFWPLAALALLLLFNALFTRGFLSIELKEGRLYGAPITVLRRASPVMLLAVGMTLVIATAGIDLSVGSVMVMAGTVAALLLREQPSMAVAAVVAASLGVALAAGLWNGVLVAFLGLQPIVATLILLVAGRGIAQLLTYTQKVPVKSAAFVWLGRGYALGLPAPCLLVAGVVLVTLLVTKLTVAGLSIEAVGNNERASRLAGLRPGLVKTLVYGFCGVCAGIAGLVATADIKQADVYNCGLYLELDAILAVVIGGTPFRGGRANVLGSIIGAIIMQMLLTTVLLHGVHKSYALLLKATAVIIVCLLQSQRMRVAVLSAFGRRPRP